MSYARNSTSNDDDAVVLRATAVAELRANEDVLSEKSIGKLGKHDSDDYDVKDVESASSTDASDDGQVLSDARDLITHVISLEDDPSLSPWTIRAMVIGLGLSTFGGVLGKTVIWILTIPRYLSTFS